VAIGWEAGKTNHGIKSASAGSGEPAGHGVAIGFQTGMIDQKNSAVAIGRACGRTRQEMHSVAIGSGAGNYQQKENAVAIGTNAGNNNQGAYSIAIGYKAGRQGQGTQNICINATNNDFNTGLANPGLFIRPIRQDTSNAPSGLPALGLYYNTSTFEICYK